MATFSRRHYEFLMRWAKNELFACQQQLKEQPNSALARQRLATVEDLILELGLKLRDDNVNFDINLFYQQLGIKLPQATLSKIKD